MRWITLLASCVWLAIGVGAADNAAPATPPTAAEPEPELEGVVVERSGGGFLTLTMEGARPVLRFFDAKKKPVAPDVVRAFVKFRLSGRRPENRTLLPAADGVSLSGGRPLRAPFVFKAFVNLVHENEASGQQVADEDESGEEFTAERYEISYP